MPTASDGTMYTTAPRPDGTCAVEVTPTSGMPEIVEGFRTVAEAEQWIYDRMTEIDSNLPQYAGPP